LNAERTEEDGTPARLMAAMVIEDVLRRGLALDDTLDKVLAQSDLPARDKGLVRAIAIVAIRHSGVIRKAIETRLASGTWPKAGRFPALMMGAAAQILYLDVPDHAAVSTAVQLIGADPESRPFAKLANAVLRRIAGEKEQILKDADPLNDDTPLWLAARWRRTYGEEKARSIAAAHGHEPSVDLWVKEDPALWASRLNALLLPTGSVRLRDRDSISSLEGYKEGAWWVQDAAASLPALVLNVQKGESVADLCAAPGGKTAQLAQAGGHVLAIDRSAPRMKRLLANMERLGLSVETRIADAAKLEAGPFDAILLDAPCSATGTIRRHPDVAWNKTEDDLAKLTALQARLLDHASLLLKPNGRMVYCTCSLEPEEGEDQIAAFLARHPDMVRDPIQPDEIKGIADCLSPLGDIRTTPDLWPHEETRLAGLDGFYAARLRKKS
jgi:16S rRNA (cytosine967-C5)-methyltransferase